MDPSIKELSIEQRIRLVEDVWDSIAADQNSLSLTEAQHEELDRRLSAYQQDGNAGTDAATVLKRIRSRI